MDIVKESENLRVTIDQDPYAGEPDGDAYTPVVRIDKYGSAEHFMCGSSRPTTHDDRITEAAERFLYPGSGNRGRHALVKYLKAFYGTTVVQFWHSGEYLYVAYDTTDWREFAGVDVEGLAKEDMLHDVRAWVEGDIWTYQVERRVKETTIRQELDGTIINSVVRDAWEDVTDGYGGTFYGQDYAEEAARDAYEEMEDSK